MDAIGVVSIGSAASRLATVPSTLYTELSNSCASTIVALRSGGGAFKSAYPRK